MKIIKTVKCDTTFYLDYEKAVKILKERRHDEDKVVYEDYFVRAYFDGLEGMDIWDFYEYAIVDTIIIPSCNTEIIED